MMNPAMYGGNQRIQKGTKTEQYMQTIRFNQSNQGTLDFQTNQQHNAQKPAEDEIEQFENGKIRSS